MAHCATWQLPPVPWPSEQSSLVQLLTPTFKKKKRLGNSSQICTSPHNQNSRDESEDRTSAREQYALYANQLWRANKTCPVKQKIDFFQIRRDYKNTCLLWKGKSSDWLHTGAAPVKGKAAPQPGCTEWAEERHISHKGSWRRETLSSSVDFRCCLREKGQKNYFAFLTFLFVIFLGPLMLCPWNWKLKNQRQETEFLFFSSLLAGTKAFAYCITCGETQSNTSITHSKSETQGKSQTTGSMLKDHKFPFATPFF